jgi:hypothetical protein
VVRETKAKPGPGYYRPMPIGFGRVTGGNMEKQTGVNIFTTCEYMAMQAPGVGTYHPKDEITRPNSAYKKWYDPKVPKQVEKEKIGPGSYNDQHIYLRLQPARARPVMSKEVADRTAPTNPDAKHVPGVGTYEQVDVAKVWKGPSRRR